VRRNEDLEEEKTNLANEDDKDEECILDDLDVEDEIEGSNSGNDGDDQGVDAHGLNIDEFDDGDDQCMKVVTYVVCLNLCC
jgi:hypothetical protein